MKGYALEEVWKGVHTHMFLKLKIILMCKPVLKGPKYNDTPFILTMDSYKFGFGFVGMLMQQHTIVLPNGTEVSRLHPVAFASKHTLAIEEHY